MKHCWDHPDVCDRILLDVVEKFLGVELAVQDDQTVVAEMPDSQPRVRRRAAVVEWRTDDRSDALLDAEHPAEHRGRDAHAFVADGHHRAVAVALGFETNLAPSFYRPSTR